MQSQNTKEDQERIFWTGVAREIAHQMGTPLSALMGWLELLPSAEDPGQIIGEMDQNLDKLRSIFDRLSQIGSPTKFNEIHISEVIAKVRKHLQRQLPSSKPEIKIREEISGRPVIWANRVLLEWILEHLGKNAIEAIPQKEGEIILRVFAQGVDVILEVTDTGRGITPEDQELIFRPGYSSKRHGRGVGLTLAKYIIENVHKGKLSLKSSRPGQGTTLTIKLKAANALPNSGGNEWHRMLC